MQRQCASQGVYDRTALHLQLNRQAIADEPETSILGVLLGLGCCGSDAVALTAGAALGHCLAAGLLPQRLPSIAEGSIIFAGVSPNADPEEVRLADKTHRSAVLELYTVWQAAPSHTELGPAQQAAAISRAIAAARAERAEVSCSAMICDVSPAGACTSARCAHG